MPVALTPVLPSGTGVPTALAVEAVGEMNTQSDGIAHLVEEPRNRDGTVVVDSRRADGISVSIRDAGYAVRPESVLDF